MTIDFKHTLDGLSSGLRLVPAADGQIIQAEALTGLKSHPVASVKEHERTPGAVAVMPVDRGSRGAGVQSPGISPIFSGTAKTNSSLPPGRCGAWAVLAECASKLHHFAKRLVCGKEWCPDCGQDDSAAHKRRQSRLISSINKTTGAVRNRFTLIRQLGYFVIEFPDFYRKIGSAGIDPDMDGGERMRGWCYSKEDLRDTTKIIVDVLAGKRCGRRGRVGGFFERGLARWHFFGDEAVGKWNPHLNVLVDAGWLALEKLEEIKSALRQALNVPDLIVNYSYCDSPGQMMHKLRYVTRATFKEYDWNPYMAEELFNFRNTRWWGKWEGEPVWTLNQAEAEGADVSGLEVVAKLQSGICPDCGQPLRTLYHNHAGKAVQWTKPVDSTYLVLWDAQEIAGSGYYRIPSKDWTGQSFSPDKVMEHTRGDAYVALLAQAQQMRKNRRDADNEAWWDSILAS